MSWTGAPPAICGSVMVSSASAAPARGREQPEYRRRCLGLAFAEPRQVLGCAGAAKQLEKGFAPPKNLALAVGDGDRRGQGAENLLQARIDPALFPAQMQLARGEQRATRRAARGQQRKHRLSLARKRERGQARPPRLRWPPRPTSGSNERKA